MAAEPSPSKVIPPGYTFLRPDIFVSTKAKEMVDDLLEKSERRNPDFHDMYIHNDFYFYALHNLIESTFATIKSKVNKKDWVEAFYAIEALTIFFDFESAWTMCDDGELTQSTNKLYGALLLEILKNLKSTNQLSPQTFPNLETVLRLAHSFGEQMGGISCKSEYKTTCKAIAHELFKDTNAADIALCEARLQEFVEGIDDPKWKEEVIEGNEGYVKELKGLKARWYAKGKIGKSEIKTTGLTTAWNKYRGQAPPVPFRGPPEWDLTKWTEEDKKPFLFDNMDDEFL